MITKREVSVNANIVECVPEVNRIGARVPVTPVEEFNFRSDTSDLRYYLTPLVLSDFCGVQFGPNIEKRGVIFLGQLCVVVNEFSV